MSQQTEAQVHRASEGASGFHPMTVQQMQDYESLKEKIFNKIGLNEKETQRFETYELKLAIMSKEARIKQLEAGEAELEKRLEPPDKDKHILKVLDVQMNDFRAKVKTSGQPYIDLDRSLREAEKEENKEEIIQQIKEQWESQKDEIVDLEVLVEVLSNDLINIELNFKKLGNKEDIKPQIIVVRHLLDRLKDVLYNLTGKRYKTDLSPQLLTSALEDVIDGFEEESDESIAVSDTTVMEPRLYDIQLKDLSEEEQQEYDRITEKLLAYEKGTGGPLTRDEIQMLQSLAVRLKIDEKSKKLDRVHGRVHNFSKDMNVVKKRIQELEEDNNQGQKQMTELQRQNERIMRENEMIKKANEVERQNIRQGFSATVETAHDDLKIDWKLYEHLKAKQREGQLTEKDKYQLTIMDLNLKLNLQQRENKILREKEIQDKLVVAQPRNNGHPVPPQPRPRSVFSPQHNAHPHTQPTAATMAPPQTSTHQKQQPINTSIEETSVGMLGTAGRMPGRPPTKPTQRTKLSLKDINSFKLKTFDGGPG